MSKDKKSNAQVLADAIDKSIDGGYPFNQFIWRVEQQGEETVLYIQGQMVHPYAILFDHDFAKALFGTTYPSDPSDPDPTPPQYERWENELRNMVIAKDPYQYLRENIYGANS